MSEHDVFKVIIPIGLQATPQVTGEATGEAILDKRRCKEVVNFCRIARSSQEIMGFLGVTHREYFRIEILNPLIKQGLLHPTIPDKPTSSKQRYYSLVMVEQ